MINSIIVAIVSWIEGVIGHFGAWGIAFLMAIESCNIPLPSEAILPFAGFMVTKGAFSIHTAAFFGAIGFLLIILDTLAEENLLKNMANSFSFLIMTLKLQINGLINMATGLF